MADRNAPCPCGSGKKFKVCCAQKRTPSQWLALVSVTVFVVLAAWIVAGVLQRVNEGDVTADPTRVWSAEHGHWHDVGGSAEERPAGPAPPGKVWSAEHGHWPDSAPAGPTPAGKVWSAEHGHWHDASGAELDEEPVDPVPTSPEDGAAEQP